MTNPARAKILVVDDDDGLRKVLEARLCAMGHEVIVAVDGEDGVNKAFQESPDLILLDIMMPKMDGLTAARRLKNSYETSQIPIVMVTALGDVHDRVRALEAGADDFLTKPVDPIELKARVQSLLKVKAYNDHMRHYQQQLESEVAARTQSLREVMRDLKSASLDTIHRLSRAAEYKDEDTGSHLQRVSQYAAAVSRRLGQPDDFTELLLYAVPMHDIGKIGIPDRILLKPGKLDPDEWRIMQSHTAIGAGILAGSGSDLLQLAASIALTHHEKWDGTGYPCGLRGDAIPLAGRITAIADVFDALCSKRSYKEAVPVEKARAFIQGEAGKQFDPTVAVAFFAVQPEIAKIQDRFRDEATPGSPHPARLPGL